MDETTRCEIDEADLAARIHSGDRSAEEEMVRRFEPGLTAIARIRSGRQAAPDLVQETLAVAIQNLRRGDWRAEGPLAAYLAAILRRLLFRRAQGKEPASSQVDLARIAASGDDPHESAEKEQILDRVRAALRRLSSRHREVLLRHYFDGQDVDQIALALGIPRGTVLSRLHHGRIKMGRMLNRATGLLHKRIGRVPMSEEP